MLICSPGKRNQAENVGNLGTVIKYNISRNDHNRIFNLSGAGSDNDPTQCNLRWRARRRAITPGLNWDGWSHGADLSDNTFDVAGTGRFGHEVQRRPDGTYEIAAGWGGATEIRAQGNKYFGNNLNLPNGLESTTAPRARQTPTAPSPATRRRDRSTRSSPPDRSRRRPRSRRPSTRRRARRPQGVRKPTPPKGMSPSWKTS